MYNQQLLQHQLCELSSHVETGRISPFMRRASSENHSTNEFPYVISARDSARDFPFSWVKIFANSSECWTIKLYQFRSKLARYLAVVLRNVLNASVAASMASLVSWIFMSGTEVITALVAGLTTSNLAFPWAATHFPLMNPWFLSNENLRRRPGDAMLVNRFLDDNIFNCKYF
ncbi:Protein of unknown function [Cotesia congregata]|uniref:Uncharacterized protein n=1 Tax=Cotesia congregata TaxID=51543 RepID=A0A8J2HR36_COTCN|nr:Protein of unknown function [Cotesia congregata]